MAYASRSSRGYLTGFNAPLFTGTPTFASGMTVTGGQVLIDAGTVGAPGLAFVGDTNLGLYRVGADSMGFSSNGVQQLAFNTGGGASTLDFFVGRDCYVPRHIVLSETTAPSGLADKGHIYAIDNGAAKTAVRVRAGAAATEATIVTEA